MFSLHWPPRGSGGRCDGPGGSRARARKGRARHVHHDPLGPGTTLRGSTHAPRLTATAAARRKTVIGELKRLLAAGAIDLPTYQARRASYEDAKRVVRKLSGRRRLELGAVVSTLEGIAARGGLTAVAPRPAVDDARAQPPVVDDRAAAGLRPARRLRGLRAGLAVLPRPGDPAPGAGQLRQAQRPLAGQDLRRPAEPRCSTSCWRSSVERGGGRAWEYYFTFDGGRPPWVSSLSQGTALQALGARGHPPPAPAGGAGR